MKKDRKEREYANKVRYILAGMGVLLLAFILLVVLYEPKPVPVNNDQQTSLSGTVVPSWSSTPPDDYNRLAPPIENKEWSSTPPDDYNRLAPPGGNI